MALRNTMEQHKKIGRILAFLLLLFFAGTGIMWALPMMENHRSGCPATLFNGAACLGNLFATAADHIAAYNAFSNIPAPSFLFVFAFLAFALFITLFPRGGLLLLPAAVHTKRSAKAFPAPKEKFYSWGPPLSGGPSFLVFF